MIFSSGAWGWVWKECWCKPVRTNVRRTRLGKGRPSDLVYDFQVALDGGNKAIQGTKNVTLASFSGLSELGLSRLLLAFALVLPRHLDTFYL